MAAEDNYLVESLREGTVARLLRRDRRQPCCLGRARLLRPLPSRCADGAKRRAQRRSWLQLQRRRLEPRVTDELPLVAVVGEQPLEVRAQLLGAARHVRLVICEIAEGVRRGKATRYGLPHGAAAAAAASAAQRLLQA